MVVTTLYHIKNAKRAGQIGVEQFPSSFWEIKYIRGITIHNPLDMLIYGREFMRSSKNQDLH